MREEIQDWEGIDLNEVNMLKPSRKNGFKKLIKIQAKGQSAQYRNKQKISLKGCD